MRTVLLASLRTHTRRYGAALLAVLVGVVLVLVTAALSSSVRDGLTAGLAEPYDGADAVLDGPATAAAVALLDAAPERGAEAWLIGWTLQPVGHDGVVLDSATDIGQVPDAPDRRWQTLEDGRFPARPGEAVVDVNAAKTKDITVGDTIRVGSGAEALDAEVVGLVDSPSRFAVATVYLLWADLSRWQDDLYVSSVAWAAGGDDGRARAAIGAVVPDAEVLSVDELVQRIQTEVNHEVDLIAIIVLLFATVSLLVAVLVINNTFTILFAQRARELALLRCVGATRRQVLRSVRGESLALGVIAAVLGTALGIAAGHGLVALIRSRWPGAGLGEPRIGPAWILAAATLAIVVTLVAAWLPARRVVRVSPLAALRPDDSTTARTDTGRLRMLLGALAVVLGGLLIAAAVATATLPVLLTGCALTFAGVLLLGPVLVPALIRGLTPLGHRLLGTAGRLAGGNAVRNPRRTATTTGSLLIGVTLTTTVLIGMASSRSALTVEMAEQHPVDVAVTGAAALPADLPARVAAVDDVAATLPVRGTVAEIPGLGELPVLAAPPVADREVRAVVHGDGLRSPAPGRIVVPWDALTDDIGDGDLVEVSVGERTLPLRVRGGDGWGRAALVAPGVLDRLDPSAGTQAVWVRAADGADPEDLAGDLEAIAAPADAALENGLATRAYVDLQLDVLTGGVVGLLAVSVLIALVGIANTLGLSVLERGREHALLRALGLTRRQLRRMLAAEAVLLSVVATLVGTALGLGFAWAGVHTLVTPVLADAGLVLPWGQLAAVVGVSAVAGLLAAVLPSRRASRVTPAAGLSLE